MFFWNWAYVVPCKWHCHKGESNKENMHWTSFSQNTILFSELNINFFLLWINMYHSSTLGNPDKLLIWGNSSTIPNIDELMLNCMCQRLALSHEDFFIVWSQHKWIQLQLGNIMNMRFLSGSANLPPCWKKDNNVKFLIHYLRAS